MTLILNRDFEPRTGEAVAVASGVRRVTAGNSGPFTFRGTNTFLIGEEEIAILDPGPDDPAHIDAIARAIGDAEVTAILVTHTHRDHSPAARTLQKRFPAPLYAIGPHRPARPPRPGEALHVEASADVGFLPDVTLAEGAVVAVGGLRLETVATPGHTANHAAFALPDQDILFSGDHVMGWSTTVVAPPDGSMADYMASLERLLARPETLYLPAHGPAITDAHGHVRALQAHRRAREAAILRELRHGERSVAELVERIYGGLDPTLAPAAALSVFAHLEDLVARAMAATAGEPTLSGRYRAADVTPAAGSG